jgi:EmrB/QacA subfamily drug resistance transporter
MTNETDRSYPAVLAVTGVALFMIVLDNLIVLSSLPSIERSLGASLEQLEWVVDAYILSFAVLMLTGAALGERFGRRRVLVGGLLVFSLSSAAAALSTGSEMLIAARVVQGAGGAVLMPLTLTLLSTNVASERRASALGIWSAIAGLGVALGPIAGGLITSALSWHWIFWVNVPVGLVAAVAAPRVLAESRGAAQPLDLRGLALVTAGLLGLVWATVRGNAIGWDAPATLAAYGAGIVLLAAFVRRQATAPNALLPLNLFRHRAFSIANGAGFLLHFAMFGAFFLVIQFLAGVRGEGPIASGLYTLPWTAMPLIVSPLAGRLGQRVHPAAVVAAGLTLITAGIGTLALVLTPHTTALELAPGLWAIGVGIGLTLPNLVSLALSAVSPQDVGRASATLSTARQLGSVFGVAVPVAIFELAGSRASAADIVSGSTAALTSAAIAAAAGALLTLAVVPRVRAAIALARA